jgi:DNA-binding response OmpR family regulator
MRVLIIDDYIDYAIPLRDLFALEGYEAMYCLSGTNAIQVALEFRPQWIVIDVRIPYKSGVKVYTDLDRQANFEFSAVFYTNYYTDQELKDVLKTIEQTDMVIIPKSPDLPGDVVDKLIPALQAGYLKGGKKDGQ